MFESNTPRSVRPDDWIRGEIGQLHSRSIGMLARPLILAAFAGCLGEHSRRALQLLGDVLVEREHTL